MRNLAIFILTFFVVFFAFQPAQAQKSGSFPTSNLGLSYDFGKYITFQATLTLPSAPSEAYLVFQAEGEQNTHIIPIQLDAQGKTSLRYEISQGAVRPFAIVRFHYQVKLQNG
jgi:hypothetical protein